MHYIDIIGGTPVNDECAMSRRSSIMLALNGLTVVGNLPHGYQFEPKSKKDAQALINYLQKWIESN